ncbi:MAG TPA: hypothetical protein VFA78_09850 [Chloroflexota bacterium]|nr:hypothetical protein [Chloroflexota bacterium]
MRTTVVQLYVHGERPSREGDTAPTPMIPISSVDAVEGNGLRQDERYYRPGDPGLDRKRQVSLIDEGTIWRHEMTFGSIDRALIKSQIILAGEVDLPNLLGAILRFDGGAELTLSLMRKPCFAMDLIHEGLKEAMKGGNQGALARVTRSGIIAVGQTVEVIPVTQTVEVS